MIEVRAFREAGTKCWRCKRRCRWLVGKGGLTRPGSSSSHALTFIIHACGLHVSAALDKAQKALEAWDAKPLRERFPHTTIMGE